MRTKTTTVVMFALYLTGCGRPGGEVFREGPPSVGQRGEQGPRGPRGFVGQQGPVGPSGSDAASWTKDDLYLVEEELAFVGPDTTDDGVQADCREPEDVLLHGGCNFGEHTADSPEQWPQLYETRPVGPTSEGGNDDGVSGWRCSARGTPKDGESFVLVARATCVRAP